MCAAVGFWQIGFQAINEANIGLAIHKRGWSNPMGTSEVMTFQ
jgi:hypothetical protein